MLIISPSESNQIVVLPSYIFNSPTLNSDACANLHVAQIPTIGEWGLIMLALILLSFSIVAIKDKEIVTLPK